MWPNVIVVLALTSAHRALVTRGAPGKGREGVAKAKARAPEVLVQEGASCSYPTTLICCIFYPGTETASASDTWARGLDTAPFHATGERLSWASGQVFDGISANEHVFDRIQALQGYGQLPGSGFGQS